MKKMIEYHDIPVNERQVDIVHILRDGTVIFSAKELFANQDKFNWVNIIGIQRLVITLRPMTDSNRKSIVAIFETGEIKQYPNVSKNFTDYTLLNKSGL
jgi:hypothetical protein